MEGNVCFSSPGSSQTTLHPNRCWVSKFRLSVSRSDGGTMNR